MYYLKICIVAEEQKQHNSINDRKKLVTTLSCSPCACAPTKGKEELQILSGWLDGTGDLNPAV